MPDKVFIDSNIFIYAKIKSQDAKKHIGAQSFLRSLDRQVIISIQVVNEFYSTLVRIGVDDATIQSFLKQIMQSTLTQSITKSTIELCWKMRNGYHYSYYDSLILASAFESGCNILYSEDMQHGQVIEKKLKIVNPFNNGHESKLR
jgi:predicted nucleic acid-binding protein